MFVGKTPPWHCGLQLPKQLRIPFTFVHSFAIAAPVTPQYSSCPGALTQPAVRSPSTISPRSTAIEIGVPCASMERSECSDRRKG